MHLAYQKGLLELPPPPPPLPPPPPPPPPSFAPHTLVHPISAVQMVFELVLVPLVAWVGHSPRGSRGESYSHSINPCALSG